MASKVALIFGFGPNIGVSVAQAFAAQGYRIATVSRSAKTGDSAKDYLQLHADLSDPTTVEPIFSRVTKELGHPTVVVYNAVGAKTKTPLENVDQAIAALQSDNNVNIVSGYVAAHLATKSFGQLPAGASKTFIFTGNKLPFMVMPPALGLGIGKSAAAHFIHYLTQVHKDEGYKFYFADERTANGDPMYSGLSGPAHAEFFTQLAEGKTQGPWNATFVKGKGYVDFDD